jgi:hypothetical protein
MIEDLCARRTLHAAFERVRGNACCRGADGVNLGRFADPSPYGLEGEG